MPDLSLAAELHELDVNVFESVAEFHAPGLDLLIPGLSEAANYSRLWLAAAAGIAATGGPRGRLTAAVGLAAIGVTSLVANAVVKPLARR